MTSYIPQLSEPAWRWVRFITLVLAIALLLWIAYVLRPVLTPLLAALAIAYVLNPVVSWLQRHFRVQRLAVVIVVFLVMAALVLSALISLGTRTAVQAQQLSANLPFYLERAERWLAEHQFDLTWHLTDTDTPTTQAATAPAATDDAPPSPAPPRANDIIVAAEPNEPNAGAAVTWWDWLTPWFEKHGARVATSTAGYSMRLVSGTLGMLSLLVLLPMYTFFFLWRFDDIVGTIHDHLPAAYRDTIVHVVTTIDGAVASFFRGRLIVCILVGTLTGIGWSIVGVPYALPLGIVAGTLNLVPFMSMLALPPALIFAYLGAAEAGQPWAMPAVLTMAVYAIVQGLESFLLSPAIEGKSSGLHPLVIVIVILIGAQLAGLLGMLLAIPVASTLGTLGAAWVLPEIRRLAGHPAAAAPEAAAGTTNDADKPEQGS